MGVQCILYMYIKVLVNNVITTINICGFLSEKKTHLHFYQS